MNASFRKPASISFIWSWALVLFASAAHADEAPPPLRKEIVALTQELMDALVPGRTEVWQRILADDVLITDEFGRRQTKKEVVDSVHPFPAGISGNIEIRDAHVRRYGDTAVIDCEQYETEEFFGQKFTVRYLATATYVRRDGAWRLVALQDLTLPTPPPTLPVRDLRLADYPGTYRYTAERAFSVELAGDKLMLRTRAGAAAHALDAVAKDVFMGSDDERNLLIFRRDDAGKITGLIERRKFNDLQMTRDAPK
jgi:hypothetical protein